MSLSSHAGRAGTTRNGRTYLASADMDRTSQLAPSEDPATRGSLGSSNMSAGAAPERTPYPDFHGCDGEDADIFLKRFVEACEANGYNDDAHRLALAQSHCKDVAQNFVISMRFCWHTFDEFARDLRRYFPSARRYADNHAAFVRLFDEASRYQASDFYRELQRCCFGMLTLGNAQSALALLAAQHAPAHWKGYFQMPDDEQLADPDFNLILYFSQRLGRIADAQRAFEARRGNHRRPPNDSAASRTGPSSQSRQDTSATRPRPFAPTQPRSGGHRVAAMAEDDAARSTPSGEGL